MNHIDRIIENVNATMTMEDMPLLEIDRKRIKKCLEGKADFQDTIDKLILKHRNEEDK